MCLNPPPLYHYCYALHGLNKKKKKNRLSNELILSITQMLNKHVMTFCQQLNKS